MPITKIQPYQFQSIMEDLIEEFGSEIETVKEEAIRKVGKEVTKELKKAGTFKGSGDYRKAIGFELEKTRLTVAGKVGAKKWAGLTHLLEFGHAKQNGGRTTAFNFVAPINDKVGEKYMKAMEELLK